MFSRGAKRKHGMRASIQLGPSGPLARKAEGYEHRPGQVAMADAVQDALDYDGILLVEAGTGTGKTWAYLLPAILSGRKVVISTGTRALQDQIAERDLPALLEHLGLSVPFQTMKGLSNYLCLRRYKALRESADAAAHTHELSILERWREGTLEGDRASLPIADDARIWPLVSSGSDTRIGRKCPHYEECFVTKMKRRAEDARIIVVNHHLLFADLALRGPHGGSVIPDYDAVIFDEAHSVEDIATEFFGAQLTSGMIARLCKDASRISGENEEIAANLEHVSSAFFSSLPEPKDGSREELSSNRWTEELRQRAYALDDTLEAFAEHCLARRVPSEKISQGAAESMGQLARRSGQFRDALGTIEERIESQAVAWVAKRGRGVGIGASPTEIGPILRKELLHRVGSCIFTSATLTTRSNFDFFKSRLGIDFEVDELRVPSPFDFGLQAGLYIPAGMPDPRNPSWVDVASRQILELIDVTKGGAFVLCTSYRHMHALSQACRPDLVDLDLPMAVQGELPKKTLLDRFRKKKLSVLFATSSFWEGVDVPGDALRLVILSKLPFAVPSDPVLKARSKALEERGENPFMDLLVPGAALSLTQGFGRLIRTRKDRGIVAILDPRIVQKSYGKIFLETLPPASRLYSIEEARSFWNLA